MINNLKILYVGDLRNSGTCFQRYITLKNIVSEVDTIDSFPYKYDQKLIYRIFKRIGYWLDLMGLNRCILTSLEKNNYDLVWFDKPNSISKKTLLSIKNKGMKIVSYSPDDVFNNRNASRTYYSNLSIFDYHITTKSYNVSELKAFGANEVVFINNAFDPNVHKPIPCDKKFDVSFIGDYEEDRKIIIDRLINAGITIRLFGNKNWVNKIEKNKNLHITYNPIYGEDYSEAICSSYINLGFLKKSNRDLQTTRSIEIPACKSFLLAERTSEHLDLFKEGYEADYFSSFEELLKKIEYYLSNKPLIEDISKNAYNRCIESGYSYTDVIKSVLLAIYENENVNLHK